MNRGRKTRTLCARVGCFIFVAGIVMSSTASADAKRAHSHRFLRACAVAKGGDARKALKARATSEHGSKVDEFSVCTFRTPRQRRSSWAFQITSSRMAQSFYHSDISARMIFEQMQAVPKIDPTKVRSVGFPAFWVARYRQLWVLKGDIVMTSTGVRLMSATVSLKRISSRV